MKKVKFGKAKQFLKGHGFMIALVLSVSAVGASTYIAYDSALKKISTSSDTAQTESLPFRVEELQPVGKNQENVPKGGSASDEEIITADAKVEPEAEEANNFVKPKAPYVMPVDGPVITPFSDGELVKSNTLGVWKTHDGADIAAPLGTDVLAMTNGTVSEIVFDELWGVVVVIDHGDGIFACYKGLDKNVMVSVGAEVASGDIIGKVSDTAEIEIADEPHLHLEITKNDTLVDPIEFITSRCS